MSEDATAQFIRLQTALAGRYSLERELGRGGMGIVYLARDVSLDRLIAIKLLPPHLSSDPKLRARFLNEARTAAKLSHPNIIPIFSVEELGDLVFFVMAFVDGETLGNKVRARGPQQVSEFGRTLQEVAWALAYAHGQGVVHRDVKADNIIIERGSGRALIADFGIARVIDATGATGIGEILGTAEYMSPEQASGEAVDHRSDIYSLGIVAFYGLSGKLPFEGPSIAATLAKQITQPAPSVASATEGVPRRLGKAIDRCLLKAPADRFQKAEELADAVGAAMEARRELPAAIRGFVKKSGEFGRTAIGVGVLQTMLLTFGTIAFRSSAPEAGWAATFENVLGYTSYLISAILGVPLVIGIVMLSRSLLRAGYTRGDMLSMWKAAQEREWEERAFEHGRTASTAERMSRWMLALGLPASIGFMWLLQSMPYGAPAVPVVFTSYLVSSAAWIGGGGIALWRYDGRKDLGGRLMGKFWKSRVGKWFFSLAGLGARKNASAPVTHRPTELAIGMAVDALFEALPKPARERLKELPDTVRVLEIQVAKMRLRVEELNDSLARVEPANASAGASDKRDSIGRELTEARDAAKARMGQAVSALESIRLDLLRLTAGTGSIEGVTADLNAAREVGETVRFLVEGDNEVARALKASSGLPVAR
jgi:serine/threonine-protein kinase